MDTIYRDQILPIFTTLNHAPRVSIQELRQNIEEITQGLDALNMNSLSRTVKEDTKQLPDKLDVVRLHTKNHTTASRRSPLVQTIGASIEERQEPAYFHIKDSVLPAVFFPASTTAGSHVFIMGAAKATPPHSQLGAFLANIESGGSPAALLPITAASGPSLHPRGPVLTRIGSGQQVFSSPPAPPPLPVGGMNPIK